MIDIELLSQIPLFASFPSEGLGALCSALQRRRYPKGDAIFHQNDPGASLYIIAEGRVKIAVNSPDGKQQTLAILGPGAFFGEMSLLDAQTRSADAVAMENCSLLTLGREQFLAFLRSYPEAALKLMAALCCRLRHADQLVEDSAFLDVPGRVVKTILELVESQGRPDGAAIVVDVRLSQGDIADLVGATRESVNKCLGLYARLGLLRYEKGRITVLRPEELRKRIC